MWAVFIRFRLEIWMIFVVWLMFAVLGVVAVFLGLVLEVEGGLVGLVIGRFCSVVGFAVVVVGVVGFLVSLLVQ